MIELESIPESSLQLAESIAQPMRSPVWDWQQIELFQFIFPLAMGLALSQILFGWIMLLNSPSSSAQQRLYGLLLFCVLGFFLAPFSNGTPWHLLTVSALTAIPGLFWLFSYSLFDDHFTLKRWQVVLIATTVGLPLIDLASQQWNLWDTASLRWLLVIFPEALEFLLVGMIVFVVARHWREDLVQSRRLLRVWFCSINAVILLGMLLLREFFGAALPWLISAQYLLAAMLLLITNAILLRFSRELMYDYIEQEIAGTREYFEAIQQPHKTQTESISAIEENQTATADELAATGEDSESKTAITAATAAIVTTAIPTSAETITKIEVKAKTEVPQDVLDQLIELMEEEHLYREMDLGIGQLAVKVDIKEHKLRNIINSGLGYRNFNDFLNRYRIQEASNRLAQPDLAKTPILTIALDVGFRSLSTFNKAFKNTHGLTPTEYRRQFGH